MISWTKTMSARVDCRWHGPGTTSLRSILPTKANRSRDRDAKPQVRSHRGPDGWVAEERACFAPGEQALHTGEGQRDFDSTR